MSKQITNIELAEIVKRILTGDEAIIDDADTYSAFMTAIAGVVCYHCGGEVLGEASDWTEPGKWLVGIRGNSSSPDHGGIWNEYDHDGELFAPDQHKCQNCGEIHSEDDLEEIQDVFERVAPGESMPSGQCPSCSSLCQPLKRKERPTRKAEVPTDIDQLLQVYFPELLGGELLEDYSRTEEWEFLQNEASFKHTEVGDIIVHVMVAENEYIPEKLKPVFKKAKAENVVWILFHFGG